MDCLNKMICDHFSKELGWAPALFGSTMVIASSLLIGISVGYI